MTVQVVDREGHIVPTAENEIVFRLQGAGRIGDLDNGKPNSHESYQGNRRRTFGGLALVLVRSTRSGAMILSASSADLAPDSIELKAI